MLKACALCIKIGLCCVSYRVWPNPWIVMNISESIYMYLWAIFVAIYHLLVGGKDTAMARVAPAGKYLQALPLGVIPGPYWWHKRPTQWWFLCTKLYFNINPCFIQKQQTYILYHLDIWKINACSRWAVTRHILETFLSATSHNVFSTKHA